MKIFVSTRHTSALAVHGGPIVARRHASALANAGAEVVLAAPEPPAAGPACRTLGYPAPPQGSGYLAAQRPNNLATQAVRGIIREWKPDVVYDACGPLWPVAAAVAEGVPVVSLVGDFNWFCARTFLVDPELRRCSGPDSVEKCYRCETREHPPKRRALQQVLRLAASFGVREWPGAHRLAPYRVWEDLQESLAYLARLRDAVHFFVVGDEQARRVFLQSGAPAARLVDLPQGLPAEALRPRPKPATPAEFSAARPLRIGFVGRLDVEKGFHVLAAAFDALPDDAPVELSVVHVHQAIPEKVAPAFGERRRYDRWIATGRVRLVRPEGAEALYSTMAAMDVGVVPSIAYETPSLAMLEFAAQGTPVVRSESAGMAHVIQDGVNGRTFPYGDAAALAAILRELLASPGLVERYRRGLPRIGDDGSYAAALLRIMQRARAAKLGAAGA